MKKLMNRPEDFVSEMLDGLVKAHPEQLAFAGEPIAIVRADAPVQGKVALATGGGSGHLPVFLGYVGRGLLDGCAVGDVFASPSAETMLNVTRRIHGGKGVVYIYGNYGGDVMNFDMATDMASMEDIEVRTVLVRDDVASAPPAEAARRRGVAGMVFAFKVAGAKAEAGGSLDEVVAAAEHALANLRTMGVALSPCTVPRVGKPTFTIGEGEMEIGMGIHGEPGVKREPLATADEVASRMAEAVLADLGADAGDRVAVMVNGLGATPAEELYILYRRVHDLLAEPQDQRASRLCRRIRHFDGNGRRIADHHAPRRRTDAAPRRARPLPLLLSDVTAMTNGVRGRRTRSGDGTGGGGPESQSRDDHRARPGGRRRRPRHHRGQARRGARNRRRQSRRRRHRQVPRGDRDGAQPRRAVDHGHADGDRAHAGGQSRLGKDQTRRRRSAAAAQRGDGPASRRAAKRKSATRRCSTRCGRRRTRFCRGARGGPAACRRGGGDGRRRARRARPRDAAAQQDRPRLWLGERTEGKVDPGCAFAVIVLEALAGDSSSEGSIPQASG